jgi:ABC-type nickel/cobalt efflux system permease component RcnA
MSATLTGWLLGMLLGMRHALEPDHLAALSTLAVESSGTRRGAWLGAFWGFGHAASLLSVGLLLALLEARLPDRLADGFELMVMAILVGLGARALSRGLRGRTGDERLHAHAHTHDPGPRLVHAGALAHAHDHDPGPLVHAHAHAHPAAALTPAALRNFRRSALLGVAHGLAGSGVLVALVMTTLPSTPARLGYIALFGLGSTAGMALLSAIAGWPLQRLSRSPRLVGLLATATGTLSIALGLTWGLPIARRLLPM